PFSKSTESPPRKTPMSGTQGPLETRPISVFATLAALGAFDATPFDSGELAFVKGVARALYQLDRDATDVIDNVFVLPVGPAGAKGRWILLSSTGGLGISSTFGAIEGGGLSWSSTPTVILSRDAPLVPAGHAYYAIFTASFLNDANNSNTTFELQLDGNSEEIANYGFGADD